ncbi:MAG: rhodanese-like domain-containing protein [Mameliella sp.]|nr:rhodanese-like domain-containing protein [Phaeodactylibacter sp.]NRA48862.1 rhodanese-like domain-containing protein [Phaeodactylibacter sp.]
MNIQTIGYSTALQAQKQGKGIVVDVREPAEFRDGHISYAVNLPSTKFASTDYLGWKHQEVYLVCQSGNRASEIAQKLGETGMLNVFVLDRHMEHIETQSTSEIWSVDRQFRFLLGLLIALYLMGYHLMSDAFSIIPVILCLGLVITSIIDKCYLRIGIAMMPWNRAQANLA